jgi:hypothetical protein
MRAISRGWIAARPNRRPKRQVFVEQLDDRIALSGAIDSATAFSYTATTVPEATTSAAQLNVGAPGVLAYVYPNNPNLIAEPVGTFSNGGGGISTNGALNYSSYPNFVGTDMIGYQAYLNGVPVSNVAYVQIKVSAPSTSTTAFPYTATTVPEATTSGAQLNVGAPGVLAYVYPNNPSLTAVPVGTFSHGGGGISTNGALNYSSYSNYVGPDMIGYQAYLNGVPVSNVAYVQIKVSAPSMKLLPDTPYFNSLLAQRSIDPARYDFYHPRIGTLIGLEASGMPTTPTTLVKANADFNASAARKLHAANPQQFDKKQPVLGALFELETPGSGQRDLLPNTAYYNGQRARYESNPTEYQSKQIYLGAIFAIEDFEQGHNAVVPAAAAQSNSMPVKIGSVHPAAARMGHGRR